ncbi:MAG: hypothetical protein IJB89_07695 [Akkermansia sp.]|nr:hypothetical protein [Akkermansia sp.]
MTQNQEQTLSTKWLRAKGWTLAAAARRLCVSTTHVYLVVNGKRESNSLKKKLLALPRRVFIERERITTR